MNHHGWCGCRVVTLWSTIPEVHGSIPGRGTGKFRNVSSVPTQLEMYWYETQSQNRNKAHCVIPAITYERFNNARLLDREQSTRCSIEGKRDVMFM
ncbi:hypothetical protein DPMN_154320 [Dreissena polymorpha]|uniref:Uncharacterized protein n=1 Tax=Dreissena polymorpha TaxID=45954 RepID=A0A9D4FPQ2_DREPO|nr:hypothetical protein DPMN_154320 [Dreissena polymorpha]